MTHLLCTWCRYANIGGLGFQEKLVLKKKIDEAAEKGEKPPNMPGMDDMLAEMKNPDAADAKRTGLKSAK